MKYNFQKNNIWEKYISGSLKKPENSKIRETISTDNPKQKSTSLEIIIINYTYIISAIYFTKKNRYIIMYQI